MISVNKNLNIANVLTVLRTIALAPLFILLWISKTVRLESLIWGWAVLAVFIVIALLDSLDGHLARKLDQVTNLGKILDPIADKVMVCGLMLILTILGFFPIYALVIIIMRECAVTLFRMFYIKKHHIVISASVLGKLKTVFQSIMLGFFIAPINHLPPFLSLFAYALMYIALALTVFSALDYFKSAFKQS